MSMFFDGTTDTLSSSLLSSINWQFQYNILRGWVKDSPAWKEMLGYMSEGVYVTHSTIPNFPNSSTTLSWYRKDGEIRFQVISVK